MKNQEYFFAAYVLVWAVLVAYLVRLHLWARRLERELEELRGPGRDAKP